MKKLIIGAVALCVGAMALAGCQKKREDAAPTVTPSAHIEPLTPPAKPAAHFAPASATTKGNPALPSDQSDDMSNMNNSDAAKPSTLPDSQSGTLEDSH